MVCITDPLVQKIYSFYDKISELDDLSPSNLVNDLMTQLVRACIPPYPIDVSKLCPQIQEMRTKLISLCGRAEGLMEKHYSTLLLEGGGRPLDHLHLFPYYSNYVKLGRLEFDLLRPHLLAHYSPRRRVAFIGSGPLPLSSIVLASNHLTSAVFDNFDIDASANALASRLVESDPDLSARMRFVTTDVMDVTGDVLRGYDVVYLAALVGMGIEEKVRVIEHLQKNMAAGAILMVRSAHGARAFLYPVVEPRHLQGFEVLATYHPTDEVINSMLVARKITPEAVPPPAVDWSHGIIGKQKMMMIPCKCGEIVRSSSFEPPPIGAMNLME